MSERWDVETSDGGTIAVWVDGHGPPLVLVHGSIGNHTSFEPLTDELRGDATTFTMDIEDGWQWQPGQFAGIRVPTLLLTGSESTAELAAATSAAAAAIPGARVHVLEGHGHIATRVAPEVVADVLREWLK